MKRINLFISLVAFCAIAALAVPVAPYVSSGRTINYTPASDVAAGDVVVQAALIGIAVADIPANTLGALAVQGVFDLPSGSVAIPAGTKLYWDPVGLEATTTVSNYVAIGYSIAVTTTNDAVVRVLIK